MTAVTKRADFTFWAYVAVVLLLVLVWPFKDVSLSGDHYVFLARRFLQGSLNVDNLPSDYSDYALSEGHKYVPFGPVPALLVMPFLPLLNIGVPLAWVGYVFTGINVAVFFRVLGLAGVAGERRRWATLLYFGGTVYLSIILVGISTYFAHVVCTTFLLLAIMELLERRRLPLVGLYIGLAAGARLTALFTLPFFLWMLWRAGNKGESTGRPSEKIRRIALILLGLAVPLAFLGAYNYARFGNVAETGFGRAVLYQDFLERARSIGLFSLRHVPKNLVMMLLQGPEPVGSAYSPTIRFPYVQPSQWGMGLFFTSPALLYAFRARISEPLVQACLLATLSVLVPILTYYGVGYVQFGYRYALDFMPFMMLVVARGLPDPMNGRARALIGASVLISAWGAGWLAAWL
jgi:hypothetical protein